MERKRQLQKREFGKRLSLDSSLVEYMDSNKYIEHLVTQLEEQRWNLWRQKLSVARLQREVAQSKSEGAMREKLIHELEEERHLRLESEKRLREVTLESERSRAQMRGLQEQFSRMEETVRNLLQSQGSPGQHGEGTVNIIKVYQEKLSEDSRKCKEGMEKIHMPADEDSRSESSSTEEEKEKTKLLLERLKALEAENSALALENENQREQYERCLDEVANQVVQALLTQKDLREECIKLKTRVFDLEQQNRTLSVLFQQKVKPASDLLLQKLHSRILDLSSGDLLSEAERNRSLMQSRTADAQIHECQQNVKSSIPVLKCQSQLNMTGPSRLYPRSSCSSSELSLSSACSEYSSGSSYTWNDGKTCSKSAKVVTENLQEEEEDTMTRTTCQSHVIESCCQMRTLDSGIGTFPLSDSGNRSTGRHVSKQESTLETEVLAPSQQDLLSAPSVKAKTLEREVPSAAKSQESVESIISHSTSDPAMTAKGIRPFQSRLPKPASSGIINLAKQSEQVPSSVTSASLEHTEETVENRKVLPEWTTKKTTKTKDRALRVCTYSASSSDTEPEPEYETNYFRTAEETFVELTKNNKQAKQEKQNQRKSFLGNPMSILDLYQHSLYGHFGEDGPEQLTHYSLIEQLSGASSKDSKGKESPSKLKQTEETKEDSQNRLSKISLESLNKFNSNNVLLLEKEKNCLNKVEGQKEENGKREEASLNNLGRHDVDNLESLSDSLYDSFSSCASQGSNDV
ncbi:nck-associated protein 5 [Gymnogyps californianus]|uniref:nck-associated protein 5 n=1 Tax=Gymnogyps californianus TaxID=33616 RepID=UPI0021C9330D|nr:nck-associated protein 5 [Gymnogyps californianus]